MYQRVHPTRGIGLWLVLLINAVIGGYLRKMRWNIAFYETQTKQSDTFSIFSVICVRPFKLSINSTVTKTGWLCYQNVYKLSFASVRMCECKRLSAHNFVDFCLQMTPTTSEVLRCRSPSRCPPSSLTRQTLRRRDVMCLKCPPLAKMPYFVSMDASIVHCSMLCQTYIFITERNE